MLVDSPVLFGLQPMMINTKNPSGKGPGHWELMPPGAYGAAAKSFHTAPEHSLYSPLLECPCTDRKTRTLTHHNALEKGHYLGPPPTASPQRKPLACYQ